MKYKLTDETMTTESGIVLHRIECVTAFSDVKVGKKGGWIEKEENLSQCDNCWVYGNAMVYGNAFVGGNACVCENARVCENACVCGNSCVRENAFVCGNAVIKNDGDYIVFKNNWSSGRYFTWTRSNDRWSVGCFYGTGKELIEKAYKDSKLSGDCYKAYVELVEKLKEIQK